MNWQITTAFEKKAQKLCHKNPNLRQILAKQFKLFSQSPQHPSLKLHKLQGKRSFQYAIWITADLRALSVVKDDRYIFFDLVTHNEY
jgi:mRNA-degrading endonuclease YafQ of YafQ-DinJ toxin-antitoxin module